MDIKETARRAAEASAVLLKNENLLPLAPGQAVALFGWAQWEPVLSGNGSGASHSGRNPSFVEAFRQAGLEPVAALAEFSRRKMEERQKAQGPAMELPQLKEAVNSGLMYELFGRYTPNPLEDAVPQELLCAAARETDTALWILGRKSGGEECDRHLENDFFLSREEEALLEQLCAHFEKVAVVLNVNGLVDLSWVEKHPQVKALLFLGVPGEEGPAALANLLTGRVSPSGKLAFTIARRYEDYPAWKDFSWDKGRPETILTYEDYGLKAPQDGKAFARRPVTAYREDLYLGYRYFDSFGVEPLFPFGFGLSYTSFSIRPAGVEKAPEGLCLKALVKNTGPRPGREVVQLYLCPRGTCQGGPSQELKAFAKTGELAPGGEETVTLALPWRELARYSEGAGAWVIEAGTYLLRLGISSRQGETAAAVQVEEAIPVARTGNRLSMDEAARARLGLLIHGPEPAPSLEEGVPVLTLAAGEVPLRPVPAVPQLDCSALSDRELAALCVGFGPGLPFPGLQETELPSTLADEDGRPMAENDHPAGHDGYVSPAMPEKGVHSVFYKDGPAGIGETGWPGEMLLACSFDRETLRQMGDAVARECEQRQVDVWLAPALNLHRHPLGGRNFEYYSEDPYLTGAMAAAVMEGLQTGHNVLACAKHFAANEQETYRRGSAKQQDGLPAFDAADSLVTERALRELYLKPFQMAVEAGLHCLMTSFNKINGTFAGGSRDLCTHILREEWGFDGTVVTDWGDMDIVVDGADAVAAGNDVVMPGGPPVIDQILKGLEEGRLSRREMEAAVGHLFSMLRRLGRLA